MTTLNCSTIISGKSGRHFTYLRQYSKDNRSMYLLSVYRQETLEDNSDYVYRFTTDDFGYAFKLFPAVMKWFASSPDCEVIQ